MSYGTTIKTEIYLSRMIFENKGMLEGKIEETKQNIERSKQEILMYCASTPKDILSSKEWEEEIVSFINIKVNDLLYQIEEGSVLLYKLELLLENFDERISG